MTKHCVGASKMTALLLAAVLTASPALAAKPDDAGKGHGKVKAEKSHKAEKGKSAKHHNNDDAHGDILGAFGNDQRAIIRNYFEGDIKKGNCPPGLAKKNNGCQPPGQAKKWHKGQVLPDDVIYHDLPHDLLRQLGQDNPAYKLVRVGSDILKIGVGSGLVIEAIEDLGGLF